MSETGRLLRYLVPGALVELIVVVSLLFDAAVADGDQLSDVAKASGITETGLIAVAALATFPLGFVASVLAAETRWAHEWRVNCIPLLRYGAKLSGRLFGWIDDRKLLCGIESPDNDRRQASVEVRHRIDSTASDGRIPLQQIASWLDLMNGLANAAMGVLLGFVIAVGASPWTWAGGGGVQDFKRLLGQVGACAVALVLFWVLRSSQRRVADLVERYLLLSLRDTDGRQI